MLVMTLEGWGLQEATKCPEGWGLVCFIRHSGCCVENGSEKDKFESQCHSPKEVCGRAGRPVEKAQIRTASRGGTDSPH